MSEKKSRLEIVQTSLNLNRFISRIRVESSFTYNILPINHLVPYLIDDMKDILGVRVPLQALVKRLSLDLTGGQFETVCNPGLLNHNQIL